MGQISDTLRGKVPDPDSTRGVAGSILTEATKLNTMVAHSNHPKGVGWSGRGSFKDHSYGSIFSSQNVAAA